MLQMSYDFNDTSISDLEFARRIMNALGKEMEGVSTQDFEVNPDQMKKLSNLVEFFKKAAKDLGGKIESVSLDPSNPPSGVTANFVVFDLFGEDVQRFCDVIRSCSAISMDVNTNDEICISCTVPDVFIRK